MKCNLCQSDPCRCVKFEKWPDFLRAKNVDASKYKDYETAVVDRLQLAANKLRDQAEIIAVAQTRIRSLIEWGIIPEGEIESYKQVMEYRT